MLKDRLTILQEKTDLTDLYLDGGYYSPEVQKEKQDSNVTLHYTDMTGKKPASGKIPWTRFTIENCQIIMACPAGQAPLTTNIKKKNGLLTVRFDLETCQVCPLRESCPVKFPKDSAVVRVSQKAILAAGVRNRLLAERREATSKRAAIKGTNSALKRSQGAGRLRVRRQIKCQLVIGLKIIAHNVQQLVRFFRGDVRQKKAKLGKITHEGVLPI